MGLNVPNLRALIEFLQELPDNRFDMKGYVIDLEAGTELADPEVLNHKCGTTGCIAGWTCAILAPQDLEGTEVSSTATKLLGLDGEQSFQLFIADANVRRSATRQDAIDTLQRLHDTGEVQWS